MTVDIIKEDKTNLSIQNCIANIMVYTYKKYHQDTWKNKDTVLI